MAGMKKTIKAVAAARKPKAEVGPSQRIVKSSATVTKSAEKSKAPSAAETRRYNDSRARIKKENERNLSTKAKSTGKAQRSK